VDHSPFLYTKLHSRQAAAVIPGVNLDAGKHVDDLIKALRTAVRDSQALNTGPILASVDGGDPDKNRFIHTVVPITDASGASVTRLFLYSERVE